MVEELPSEGDENKADNVGADEFSSFISMIIAIPLSGYFFWNSLNILGFLFVTYIIWIIIKSGLIVLWEIIIDPKVLLELAKFFLLFAKTKEGLVFYFFAVLITALTVTYFYKSSPSEVVVNELGEIEGIVNKARAVVQGKSFWKKQLHEVRSTLHIRESGKNSFVESMRREDRNLNKEIEKLLRENPEFNPSPAEVLRMKADQMEKEENINKWGVLMEDWRLREIAKLRKIIPIVKAKAE